MKKRSAMERTIGWFKDRENWPIIGIIALALFIRLYYFSITSNQPLWWDESDYLAYAKNLAGLGSNWIVTVQHNSIFPYIVAGLFALGLGEGAVKLIVEILPSVLIVILTYGVSRQMYEDKRIALGSAFLMVVFWNVLFNSMRFHVGVPGLFFALMAMYVFWKGYENKEKVLGLKPDWAIPLAVVFVVLSYSTRRGFFLFGLFILLYMLFTRNFGSLLKDKWNWIGLGIAIALVLFVESFVFISGVGTVGESYYHPENEVNFLPLGIFANYFGIGGLAGKIPEYMFYLGTLVALAGVCLCAGHIRKSKGDVKGDLFNLIAIIVTLAVFIFVLRSQGSFGEPRWYFPLLFSSVIFLSKGSLWVCDYIGKGNKIAGLVVVFLVLGIFGFYQIQFADDLIKNRAQSFEGIRQAGIFVNEVSNEGDIVVSQPVPQTIYYSERDVLQPEMIAGVKGNNYDLNMFLSGLREEERARYLLISFSEPGYPEWMRRVNAGAWEILFMDSRVDFNTGQQQVLPEKNFGDITLRLLDVKNEVFVYEILRS